MDNAHHKADITIRNGWLLLLITLIFSLGLLAATLKLFLNADYLESFGCLLFSAIAIWCTLTFKAITTKVYITKQIIEWSERSVLNGFNSKSISFSDVNRVSYEVSSGLQGSEPHKRLVLKCDSFTVPLSHSYSSGKHGLERLRNKLLEALTMDLSDGDFEDELITLIKQGKMVRAASYVRQVKGVSIAEAKDFIAKNY